MKIIKWDIYEVRTESTLIIGVKYRGRIRKFCLEKNRNVLTENTADIEGSVRFAIPTGEDPADIICFFHSCIHGWFTSTPTLIGKSRVRNPTEAKPSMPPVY